LSVSDLGRRGVDALIWRSRAFGKLVQKVNPFIGPHCSNFNSLGLHPQA
jgi:hypothetical protein